MRWAAAVLALFVAFYGLTYQALHLWNWGWLNPAVLALSNLVEVAMLPFSILAGLFFPPLEHHLTTAYSVARCLMASVGYVFAVALARELSRLVAVLRERPVEPSRRTLLGQLAAGAVVVPVVGSGLYCVVVEPNELVVRRYELSIKDLPADLDGLRLGHFSDSHYGPLVGVEHIGRAIAMLNAEQTDLIVLTGDYVHHTPSTIPTGIGLLKQLKARLGCLAVLGNHDHWEGAEACRAEFRRLGLELIDNDRRFLSVRGLSQQAGPDSLAICGVGDLWTDTVDLRSATLQVPPDCPRLLLSHNPDVIEQLPAQCPGVRVDLQLSGHTHGGQVSFPGVGPLVVPSSYGARYAGGLVQGPGWPVVVSRGVGLTVIPVRFGVPPEVGVITLRRASG